MKLADSAFFDVTYIEIGDRATAHLIVENDLDGLSHILFEVRTAQWRAADRASRVIPPRVLR